MRNLARAVRFIRQHACEGIGVPEVVADAGLSRRLLEQKFQHYLNRTPKDEILKVKLDRAELLLGSSEMSVESIAQKSGFPSFKNLSRLFRLGTGRDAAGLPQDALRPPRNIGKRQPKRRRIMIHKLGELRWVSAGSFAHAPLGPP